MKKEEFYFDSRDGVSRIYGVRYLPEDGKVQCVVQLVHGMAEHMGRYEEVAQFLTEKGFAVTGADLLGHGKTVPEGGCYGYFCKQDPATVLVRDVHRLKKMTQTLYPDVPYVIIGHSMGSYILRNYMCRYGTGIQGVVLLGTGTMPLAAVRASRVLVALQELFFGARHVSRMLDRMAFGHYNQRLQPIRTEWDWLTRDNSIVDAYIADPLCGIKFTVNGFKALVELNAGLYKKENLKKVPKSLPVLMLSGLEDPVGDYGVGVKKAYSSIAASGVKNINLKLYQFNRHELLNEPDKTTVMQDIYDWIRNTILV